MVESQTGGDKYLVWVYFRYPITREIHGPVHAVNRAAWQRSVLPIFAECGRIIRDRGWFREMEGLECPDFCKPCQERVG